MDGNQDLLIEKLQALDTLHGEGSLSSSNKGGKLPGEDVQPVAEIEEKDKTQVNFIPYEGIHINCSSEMIIQEHIGESRSTDRASNLPNDQVVPAEESSQLTNHEAFNSRCLEGKDMISHLCFRRSFSLDLRIDFPVEYLRGLVANPGALSLVIFGAQGGNSRQYHLVHESDWTWKHYGFVEL